MEEKEIIQQTEINKIRKDCLQPFIKWQIPTAEEVRIAMKLANLTGSELAALVGVKNSRTVRRWTGGDVEIPYAVWAILCYKAGAGMIWE